MKKFLYRKVLAVSVAGVAMASVYFYTDTTIQQKVAPTSVVVAKQDIPPHTKITKDMLFLATDIPRKSLPQENPYASSIEDVVGKWTVDGYGVTEKGFINNKKVVEQEKLPDAGLLDLKPGEYAFPILVDLETSSGNAIRPGTYVDLFFSTKIEFANIPLKVWKDNGLEFGKISVEDSPQFFGKLASKARVVDVKDSRANDVYTTEEYTEPAADVAKSSNAKAKKTTARLYTIAVDLETLQYLNKGKLKGEVIPVAHGESYAQQGEEGANTEVLAQPDEDISVARKVIEVLTFNPTLK